jgi:hypothetical protein
LCCAPERPVRRRRGHDDAPDDRRSPQERQQREGGDGADDVEPVCPQGLEAGEGPGAPLGHQGHHRGHGYEDGRQRQPSGQAGRRAPEDQKAGPTVVDREDPLRTLGLRAPPAADRRANPPVPPGFITLSGPRWPSWPPLPWADLSPSPLWLSWPPPLSPSSRSWHG